MTEQTPRPVAQAETPKLSVLDETKAAIADLKKEREEITKIKEELNQLRSDQLLSGTGGIRQDTQLKVETAKEYRQRILRELREGKYG